MKALSGIILAIAISFNCAAQTYVVMAKSPGEKLWGYLDLNGNFVIKPQFTKCLPFSEDGLALIQFSGNQQLFYVNVKGDIIKPKVSSFKLIKGFDNGMAPINQKKRGGTLIRKETSQ